MNLEFLKSPHGEEPIIVEAEFSVSPARLFQAWTTPSDIKAWFGGEENRLSDAKIELRTGGHWEFSFAEADGEQDVLSGKYLQIEPDRLLKFSWRHTRKLAGQREESTAESIVEVTFEASAQGTYSRLVHQSVNSEGARLNIGEGWCSSFTNIRELLR